MNSARTARNGIVWLGTITMGATWGTFFPPAVLSAIILGALVALLAIFIASFT